MQYSGKGRWRGRRFNYIGPQAEKLLGYPAENWYLPGFWLDHVHEEDRERVERFWQGEADRRRSGQTIEYRMRDARGETGVGEGIRARDRG